MRIYKNIFLLSIICSLHATLFAQPLLKTGAGAMPNEWIDADTHHRVIKLTRSEGSNMSFYFHNNPFVGDNMVYYNSEKYNSDKIGKQETSNVNAKNKQLYSVNIKTFAIEQLSHHATAMKGEIVSAATGQVYFQVADSIFGIDIKTKQERLVFVFPADFKGDITSVNANGTLIGGAKLEEAEKEISRANPEKHDYFNKIYEAKLKRTLFTIEIKNGKLNPLFSDTAWLNHVQFSTTDPDLLMFCHEGPWHKVDRIWTINVITKKVTRVHKRTMDMEIAGHEWFSRDGKTIWFDLQQPRGATFFVGGYNIASGKEMKYELLRNEWSVHYTSSPDEKYFAGDGGDSGAVAKAPDGKWIYFFTPKGNKFVSEKLVNMSAHRYKLEPNVHFSPDGKWIIFRANFEGDENVYAVEIAKIKL